LFFQNIRKKIDKDGNEYTEEEIIGPDNISKIVRKRIDKDGNQIEVDFKSN